MKLNLKVLILTVLFIFSYQLTGFSQEEDSEGNKAAELAKATANPLANMISVPIQLNLNFGMGTFDRTQTLINLMPVLPLQVGENVNLINRIILPIMIQPDLTQSLGNTFGIGDINYSMFFTPAKPGSLIWGFGPAFNIPTRTSNVLGSPEFGIGPTLVLLTMPGNWALGLTANNVWSYESDTLNALFSQVFVTYTFPSAWFINFSPTITANWNAADGEQWTVPLSFNTGVLKVFGKQPIKFTLGGSYFVQRPTNGPDWQVNFQMVFLFKKNG